MAFKSDAPLPSWILRAVGGALILLALLIGGAALSEAPLDWRAIIAVGVLGSILAFTGLVLMFQDKSPGAWRRLFHFFYGSLSLMIGVSLAGWIAYSLIVDHAPPAASPRKIVLLPLVFLTMGAFWVRHAIKMGTQGNTRSGVKVLDDRILLTSAAKFDGIRREIRERGGSRISTIVLVAHFPDVLEALARVANEAYVSIPIVVSLAKSLTADLFTQRRPDESSTVLIIVGEHHPAPSHDDAVIRFAESLNCRCQIEFHASLEDPLLKVVAAGVQNMLRQAGMKEDEPIQSRMVSRRLRAAQKRLASRTFGDSNAATATEWLAENMVDFTP
jgi:hypothetical protein